MNHIDTNSAAPLVIEWKPVGRGRRFDRLARGLARRLRLPFVRDVLWEREHGLDRAGMPSTTTYGSPWTSMHCLANF